MPASVHGGSIGRWFEELCRIKHETLRSVVVDSGTRLRRCALPDHGGVYVFWWTGEISLLTSRSCNRSLALTGPGGSYVALHIDDSWLGIQTGLPIPLYVGKSDAGIAKRIGLHLCLSQARILPRGGGAKKAKPPTTSCQLRAGIEHLFPNERDTRQLTLENVGLSFVALGGHSHAADRFYLEDLAIGLMRPALNVDIER